MKKKLTTILTLFLLSCGKNSETKSNYSDTLITLENAKIPEEKTVLSSQNCGYKNDVSDLGIGLIIVPDNFDIFEDSLLTRKIATINMYQGTFDVSICPIFFKPDYGIMNFICLDENKKSYKVLSGFSDIKYLPKKENYEYITWQNYILESYGVRRSINDNNKPKQSLKEKPTDYSKTLIIPNEYEMFCPLEIKGDFLKVKYVCFYNLKDNPNEGEPYSKYIDKCTNPLTGWLKWKTGNKLLIDILLMP